MAARALCAAPASSKYITNNNGSFSVTNIKNIAIAAALLTASFAASAQDAAINPNWYLQPSAGIMRPDSEWGVDKDDRALGLRFGKAIAPSWDLQMGFSDGATAKNGSRYQQQLLGVDALYLFSRKAVRPFLLVGVGAERDKLNMANTAEARRTSPYVAAGLGLQSQINDRWFFQTDLRNVHGMIRGDELRPAKVNNQYLNFSLNYLFGGAPQAAAPAPVAAPMVEPTPAPVVAPEPVAPPPPAPAPVRFEKVTMAATELFAFDSAKLADGQPKLDDMAKLLNENPGLTGIVISGYTDRLGSDKYNQKLSERRAEAVKAYLVSKGVAGDRLKAVGKGKANPVASCDGKKQKRAELIQCLEPNRRVEVEQVTVERKVK
jgi:OOP family OmpA-OmpF porin